MTTVIEVRNLSKNYRKTAALHDVSFDIEQDTIYGLLGRNGAGKTTAMSILTAQDRQSSGEVRVFGEGPYENPDVLSRMCFVREGQKYPDEMRPSQAFAAGALFFPNWDARLAAELAAEFRIPMGTRIKKLSRGQNSAVGVVIGLAAGAEITFFDEPHLGLDAVARQIFYDRLIEEYARRPRAIVLSSHLIDEISPLIERVLVLDGGELAMDTTVEEAQSRATNLVGNASVVEPAVRGHEILRREALGGVVSVTILGALPDAVRAELASRGVEFAPVSLQELIVRTSRHDVPATADGAATALSAAPGGAPRPASASHPASAARRDGDRSDREGLLR